MDNTREKLIELLRSAINTHTEKKEQWILGGKVGKEPHLFASFADHLIANGVTLDNQVSSSKWISVKDRLPESMTEVLCWYEYFRFGNYNRMYQTYGIGYYFRDGFWGGEVSNGQNTRVIAWMPLPEPPKGE